MVPCNKQEVYMAKKRQQAVPKLITAKQVQEEYLPQDIRIVRAFLRANCKYRKIGRRYFYVRQEVEEKLIKADGNVTYRLDGSAKPNNARRESE